MTIQTQQDLARPTKTSDWAAVALIAGILGLTLLPFVGSLVAIIAGYVGKSDINHSMGRLTGGKLASWGLILGWIGMSIFILGLCLVVIIPLVGGVTLCSSLPGLMESFGITY